jgi:calcium-dependent protein kinase
MLPLTVAAVTTSHAAVQVVATHLPPEEIEGIRQMFMDMDRDGSGTISYAELKEGER